VEAAQFIRESRKRESVTQAELARRLGVGQGYLSDLESGKTIPRVDTYWSIARALGYEIQWQHHRRINTIADYALEIRKCLQNGASSNEHDAFRTVIQLADDLSQESIAERVVTCFEEPPTTGDVRFDAMLAGVVAYRLREAKAAIPGWAAPERRRLESEWIVQSTPGAEEITRPHSIPELRKLNILVGELEFSSV
jgi:transcriptional regulator with XRE-family HTH domain